MKIYTCKYAGLCSGAKSAVDAAYKNINENLYMYGEVLHNPTVISQLKEKGAKIVNSINEIKYLENKDDFVLLIRAHGVPKSVTQTSHTASGNKALINAGWDTNQLISCVFIVFVILIASVLSPSTKMATRLDRAVHSSMSCMSSQHT